MEYITHLMNNHLATDLWQIGSATGNLALVILSYYVSKIYIKKLQSYLGGLKDGKIWQKAIMANNVFAQLPYLLPVLFVYNGLLPYPAVLAKLGKFIHIYLLINIVFTVRNFLWCLDYISKRSGISKHPITGYVQLTMVIIYCLAALVSAALLMDISPWKVLSGLTAATAMLVLVFRDTLSAIAAGMQIRANNLIQINDWIEVPQFGADGDVVEESLNFIKVRNFDKTEVSIPIHRLIETGFKNWRGMYESGGRRIKSNIYIDQHSVTLIGSKEIDKIYNDKAIAKFLPQKSEVIEGDHVSNLRLYRNYIINYLKHSSNIHHENFTFIVNILDSTPEGIPIQLYVFANTTVWADYEEIKSQIFEHLLSIVPRFGLTIFQTVITK